MPIKYKGLDFPRVEREKKGKEEEAFMSGNNPGTNGGNEVSNTRQSLN